MCLHIDSLPNELLLVIFDLIPLSDLLRLDLVCHQWANLLASACARRRTLVLLILAGKQLGEMDQFRIPFNSAFEVTFDGRRAYFDLPVAEREASLTLPNMDIQNNLLVLRGRVVHFTERARLQYARLSGKLVTYLKDLFPKVDNLVVIHPECGQHDFHSVIDLLDCFCSLNILKLWIRNRYFNGQYEDHPDHHPVCSLLGRINDQSSLRQLTLDIDGFPSCDNFSTGEFCPFIARLKALKLYLGMYDCDNAIWDIVHRFDQPELSHIGLGNEQQFLMLKNAAALKPEFEFTIKVCQIYTNLRFKTRAQLGELCWRLPCLTTLRIDWSDHQLTFTKLVSNLALLEQLTHLVLSIPTFDNHSENMFALVDRVDENDQKPRPSLSSLPQVKILQLLFYYRRYHHYFESLSPLVFPSVEVVTIVDEKSRCRNCKLLSSSARFEFNQFNHCHLQLILSLENKFTSPRVRVYAKRDDDAFVDWTYFFRTEDWTPTRSVSEPECAPTPEERDDNNADIGSKRSLLLEVKSYLSAFDTFDILFMVVGYCFVGLIGFIIYYCLYYV